MTSGFRKESHKAYIFVSVAQRYIASLFAFVPLLILSSSCSDFIFVSLVILIQVTLQIVQARKVEGGGYC